jgi:hypothetical protein
MFRTAEESTFSDLNDLGAGALAGGKFGSFFGFAGEEAGDVPVRFGSADKMDEIRERRGGPRSGKTATRNPWSILNRFGNNCGPRRCRSARPQPSANAAAADGNRAFRPALPFAQ